MKKIFSKKNIRFFFVILLITSSVILIYQIYDLVTKSQDEKEVLKRFLRINTNSAVNKLDKRFKKLSSIVDSLEKKISNKQIDTLILAKNLKKICRDNKFMHGIEVACKSDYFNNNKLFSNYTFWSKGKIITKSLSYDYTKKDSSSIWYHEILEKKKNWLDVYFGKTSKEMVAEYGVPFYKNENEKKEGKASGVISANYSLDNLKDIMTELDLGKVGYAFIISPDEGKLIYHPIKEYVHDGKTLLDLSEKNKEFTKFAKKLKANENLKEKGHIRISDENKGENYYLFYQKIPETNWILVSVFPIQNLKSKEKRENYFYLLFNLIIMVSLILSFFIKIDKLEENNLWFYSSIFSVILIIGIVVIWLLILKYPHANRKNKVIVSNQSSANKFIKKIVFDNKNDLEKPLFVPTGIFVQSFNFSDANDVDMTGYIWQKYKVEDTIRKFEKGIIFPESVNFSIEEAYKRKSKDGKWEVIGWYFETTLRQSFDYSKYPFDNKDVWIRLWHKDFDKNIYLIPDLTSYEFTNPILKPGLDKEIVISDWTIKNSYFSYVMHKYSTDFGIETYSGQGESYELYYTMTIQRNFISPFISVILPFFVIIVLLFAMVLNVKEEGKSGFLASAGGLLFTILLAHFGLRESLSLKKIVYIENFYFVLYFAILLLVITTFLYFKEKKIWFIDYNDSLFIKILFWPVILGFLFIITAITYF